MTGVREHLLMQAERARERADRLEAQADTIVELDLPDEDPYENGAIIAFVKTFHPNTHKYQYAAIKVMGLWYTSGPRSAGVGFPWPELRAFLNRGVDAVWEVTELELAYGEDLD